ncbi:MAG: OmpA family protein [Acidobacteriota bacterium]
MPAAFAQAPNPTAQVDVPIYRVSVVEYVERTTKAVNYRHRGGSTKIDFEGTPMLPKGNGEAKVESKKGYIEIEVEFDDLKPATSFGPEYLTYVLWAITPEGRPTNMGELLLDGNRGKLNVTTELQAFSMLVTAEPYFAVSTPSDVVVLENVIRPDTAGKIESVDAKFELLGRGVYMKNVSDEVLAPQRVATIKTPLEVREADNTIRLARAAGAGKYAPDTLQKAINQLAQADTYLAKSENRKPAIMSAREAVQTAEDARLLTLQRREEARLAKERSVSEEKTAQANRNTAVEADARRLAELDAQRAAADRSRAQAEATQAAVRADAEAQARRMAEQEAQRSATQKAEADAARLAAEKARLDAEAAGVAATREADAARVAAERAKLELDTARVAAASEADRLVREREAAENARQQAVSAQEAAQRDAQQARELAAKADQERTELRSRLQQQLNLVLETKQTARGLIVNISDVLFEVGKSTLKPGAREKLSKVAGIISVHADLALQVEGHTDSTGSDELNQRLSESRAAAARDFLISQGLNSAHITARGFGEKLPVASNDNAAGRQQNRRVELVISGESIISGDVGSARSR